jgi:hypothetical protein
MYGPLFAGAAILLGIAGIVLYLSDVSLSRAERAARSFDRAYVRNRAARHRRLAGKAPARGDHRQATRPRPRAGLGMLPRARYRHQQIALSTVVDKLCVFWTY